jgi:aryl-alcohol dehydrogenase-like predicted oxidoreductase
MEYRTLGRTGVMVSPICLGSDDFGDATPPDIAAEIILRALDAGINLIDTGNLYAEGESEKIIGKTLKDNNLRHQVIISTKVDHAPRKKGVSLDEYTPQMAPNTQGNSRLNILRACELSLQDLQTDYIDIFQIHRYYPEYHIEETLGALTDLIRQGKVRYVGCSTFPPWKIMHAIMLSELKGYARFICEESPYNLLDRRIENELIPLAQENGLGILGWAPLAHGMLLGFYSKEDEYPEGTRAAARGSFYADRVSAKGIKVGKKFVKLSEEAGLTPAQLGVLWSKEQPGITAPLIGPQSVEHLEDLIPVLEKTLSDELREACDELVPPGSAVANFHNTAGWMKEQLL